ncbi:hypothetical protein CHUAL_011022 [Chamberlinius hualienensis]
MPNNYGFSEGIKDSFFYGISNCEVNGKNSVLSQTSSFPMIELQEEKLVQKRSKNSVKENFTFQGNKVVKRRQGQGNSRWLLKKLIWQHLKHGNMVK